MVIVMRIFVKLIKKLLKFVSNYDNMYLQKGKFYLFVADKPKNFNTQIIHITEERLSPNERKNGKIMCKAAEVGKIVVNKCLDRGLFINTQKLQKLLVLMQVECIRRSKKPLFKEDVRVWDCGVAITEVNTEFSSYGEEFTEKIEEFITLLEAEEESVNYVLEHYGHMDAYELNAQDDNTKVIELGVKTESSPALHISYQILMGAFS